MLERPATRWATASDGVSLAFQVFGDGPVDLVIIPPFARNVDLAWECPEMRRMLEQMGSFARVVHFDKRGTGCSDRTVAVAGLDQRVDDARAVMDAAGVGRCVLYGLSEGGPMAMLFATTYPARVSGLVLHATDARIVDLDAESPEEREQRRWGDGGCSPTGGRNGAPCCGSWLRRRGPIRRTGPGSPATSGTAPHLPVCAT